MRNLAHVCRNWREESCSYSFVSRARFSFRIFHFPHSQFACMCKNALLRIRNAPLRIGNAPNRISHSHSQCAAAYLLPSALLFFLHLQRASSLVELTPLTHCLVLLCTRHTWITGAGSSAILQTHERVGGTVSKDCTGGCCTQWGQWRNAGGRIWVKHRYGCVFVYDVNTHSIRNAC